jgi:rod shape-determining protein MreC
MSVVGHPPPPFFKRGPAPLARLAFFVILSLALLVFDLKYRTLEWVRQGVAVALYPLQRAAYTPVDLYEQVGAYFSRLGAVQQENAELKRKELESANWLLRQQHLELENQRLRELLDMRARQPVSGTLAEILYTARDPFSRRVIVDKGSQHGIAGGQAVVDESGVLGQVTRVLPAAERSDPGH